MRFDYNGRYERLLRCCSLEQDVDGEPILVIDKPAIVGLLAEFAECDWDAGNDSGKDGSGFNPHKVSQ